MLTSAASKRDISIDITRIIAFASVPAVHFFLNTSYYVTPIVGIRMYAMTIVRNFFMICVPLFLMITGYLMSSKEVKLEGKSIFKFYSKLTKIIVTYLLANLTILLWRIYVAKELLPIKNCILSFLGFEQYSWYVNMYICLFLLIPFLNLLWKAAGSTKQGHLIVVICLVAITVASSIFNVYDFNSPGALTKPWLSVSYNQIVPYWFDKIYPITYYFIGAYLKTDVDIKKIKTWKVLLLLIGSVAVFGLYNVWRNYSVVFKWGDWCAWESLQNTVNATLVFLLINSIRISNPPAFISKPVKLIANLTFGAYILSYIPDHIFYRELAAAVPEVRMRLGYMPLVVGKVILFSLVCSLGIYIIVESPQKIFKFCRARSSRKKQVKSLDMSLHH